LVGDFEEGITMMKKDLIQDLLRQPATKENNAILRRQVLAERRLAKTTVVPKTEVERSKIQAAVACEVARHVAGLSKHQAADIIGVDDKVYARWERDGDSLNFPFYAAKRLPREAREYLARELLESSPHAAPPPPSSRTGTSD
jgi:DNA-binding XRE family transcriptional regulator